MYRNRSQAGKHLAEALEPYKGAGALVLGLPRGGVEVAYEIAEALDAELDVLVVRKLGAPQNPELGLGAIASYGARFIDDDIVSALNVPAGTLERIEQDERREMHRRQSAYRGDAEPPRLQGRTVIIVDDGIATGGTAMAAIRAVRTLKPQRIILAVPVAPPDSVEKLKPLVDELVCPCTPEPFMAIGQWYEQFDQTSDKRVIELLQRRRAEAT